MGQLKNILTKRNVNTCDENGNTLLILASSNGKLEICAALLNRRALVDIQNNFGWAALNVAAFHGYVQVCTLLLKNNACVNQQIKDGASPLFIAAQEGHVHVCKILLENNAHVDQEKEDGASPLFIAVERGHVHVCTLLLENNAHVNQPRNTGASPLFIAAQEGHVHVCALLLENNAHVNQEREDGASPLFIAVQQGHVPVCTLLLENNAHVNQEMEDGASPLFTAAQEGHVHLCTLLLDNSAHVNQERNDGMTPLMIASFLGHAEVCEFLLLNNADINLKDENGHNALFHAVRQKRYDTCKLLIQHGVDVNLTDNNGKSILKSVNATDDENIISLIRKHKHTKTVNKEIEETRKHLKKLEMKQILDRKRQRLAQIENAKARIDELKQLLLEKKKERGILELHVEFLIENINDRNKGLSVLTTGNSQIKLLLQQQNTECQAKVNNMLDKISDINQSMNKYTTEIKTTEMRTTEYEKQKREYEFYNKRFQEGKYDKIIKELNKECPICFEEMLTPIKIFQCSQGHLLCENCFKKVSDSAKVCPFCKRDVVTIPIRNRALEEAIENEARKDMGAANRN